MALLGTTRLLVFQEKFQTTYNFLENSFFHLSVRVKHSLKGKYMFIFVETILVKL